MGTILVVAEIQKGAIRESSYELVSAARAVAEAYYASREALGFPALETAAAPERAHG